jgi:hypothetical protein
MQNTDFSPKMQQIARKAAQAEHKKKILKKQKILPPKNYPKEHEQKTPDTQMKKHHTWYGKIQ